MARKVTYWVTTILLAALSFLAAYGYLLGGPQSAQGFAHVGYPQQLRIILGIAKPLGGIALIVPGMVKLKEWPQIGMPLMELIQRIMIGAEIFRRCLRMNGSIEHPA